MALWGTRILSKFFVTGTDSRPERFSARIGAELAIALIGIALLVCAFAANREWLDRHFLPPFFVSRRVYVLAAFIGRAILAALGLVLVLVARPRIGRFIERER